MHLRRNDKTIRICGESYQLATAHDRPFVYLECGNGERLAELFVLSSVHPLHDRDDTVAAGAWEVEEREGVILLSLVAHSSVWAEKRYRFRCYPERFIYEVEVAGRGALAEVHYFGGYYSGNLRWGSGFFPSGQQFAEGFSPEPNDYEASFFAPDSSTAINLTGVPLPGRGDWFFTPPPFCFALAHDGAEGLLWTGIGVEAPPGQNSFADYGYNGGHGTFFLTLNYEGHTAVDGRYRLPAIGFDFASGPYEAVAAHVAALREAGCVTAKGAAAAPAWWRSPLFCGWGSQCYLASLEPGRPADFARQETYEGFLLALAMNEVDPGIVVLDDKWQASYGGNEVDKGKWPDLPGFVAHQHAAGRHVLLWLKAWDPEGVPAAECITNAGGLPIAVDPTNPAYERRLRTAVRRMLAADGYNADGFKIDFSARIPSGPGIRTSGQLWGLELMRRYLQIIYEEAKQVKADALIMTHTPHPYLADVVDMLRLNDMNVGTDIVRAMQHRAQIASIACPGVVIDTDNWPVTDRATWRAYLPLQAELGVPSLYYVSHVDATGEPLLAEDYELIRRVWQRFRERQADKELS
ncbi:MAG: hypothetical protein RRC07_07730 [Anaerolineae bacterium]|nr:hypothetical protein [Anaerolineae bacterium]